MLCQRCKKQSATVHLTTVVGNEMQEKHLCGQCAANEGEVVKPDLPLDKLVEKFVLSNSETEGLAHLSCPQCGMTFMQFRNTGLLGCPHDYDAFAEPLTGLLERAHGGKSQHVGKVPGGVDNKHKHQHQLMQLKRDLDHAVMVEDYETAVRLRDSISRIEQG